jgi:hypothetical protein
LSYERRIPWKIKTNQEQRNLSQDGVWKHTQGTVVKIMSNLGLAPKKFLLRRYSKSTTFSETRQYLFFPLHTTMNNFVLKSKTVAAICKHCVKTNAIWFL